LWLPRQLLLRWLARARSPIERISGGDLPYGHRRRTAGPARSGVLGGHVTSPDILTHRNAASRACDPAVDVKSVHRDRQILTTGVGNHSARPYVAVAAAGEHLV